MGPLLSWDIFMAGYHKKFDQIDDLKSLNQMSLLYDWTIDYDMEEMLLKKGLVVLVTDPSLSISFASSNIAYMNGYRPEEVVGRKASMFQGPATSDATRATIRTAIKKIEPFHVSMINYRKNGSSYVCDIHAVPLFNSQHQHAHFMAFEKLVDHDA